MGQYLYQHSNPLQAKENRTIKKSTCAALLYTVPTSIALIEYTIEVEESLSEFNTALEVLLIYILNPLTSLDPS